MVFIILVITIRIIKQFPWLSSVMPSWVDNLKCANQILSGRLEGTCIEPREQRGYPHL